MKFIERLLEMWALANLCRRTGLEPLTVGAIISTHYLAMRTIAGKDKSDYDKVIEFYALSKAIVKETL